jgi:hypothetical protein
MHSKILVERFFYRHLREETVQKSYPYPVNQFRVGIFYIFVHHCPIVIQQLIDIITQRLVPIEEIIKIEVYLPRGYFHFTLDELHVGLAFLLHFFITQDTFHVKIYCNSIFTSGTSKCLRLTQGCLTRAFPLDWEQEYRTI